MTAFTTRVELHDAAWDDYTTLHERMFGQGFARTIVGDTGARYQLPPAEYNISGALTRNDVLNKAKAAAGSVKQSYAVFVTESAGRSWHGLPLA